jgi:acyl-CoA dehydrogenase
VDFEPTPRSRQLFARLAAFVAERVIPAEQGYEAERVAAGDPHAQPAVMEELKAAARERGLWNLFHPDPEYGAGLSNAEYAPLAELTGRSRIAAEACNCAAPDTGNMELLSSFGSERQRERWLAPLLDGTIRSAFAMTEPGVASSDATNVALRMERDGDGWILNGRKWWASGVKHPNCRLLLVMGRSDPEAARHRQHSIALVPLDAPGLTVVRSLPVLGFHDQEGHAELVFEDVRVPAVDLLGEPGAGFAIGQARLGPGRIHHCMRAIGAAERALELLCARARERVTFGAPLAERANVQDWIAESRVEIEMARALTLKTAWMIDTAGARAARREIAAIKIAAPAVALKAIDRAIQVHGAGGLSDDFPLASLFAYARSLRLADGPDEVHKRTVARLELKAAAAAG